MNQEIMSHDRFNKMMQELNLMPNDIVYIEAKISLDTFNPIYTNMLIHRLLDYLGDEGTLVMSLSGFNNSINKDIARTDNYTKYVLPFQSSTRPIYSSSILSNYLSIFKEAKFSESSFYPFVAIGRYASLITNGQSFDFPNGGYSPFARLYELRAKGIMINHDIKSFVLNKHVFEISSNTTVSIGGGIVDRTYESFLERKVDDKVMTRIFNSKRYKELFYFSKIKEIPILGIEIRDYVDYCRKFIEE